MGATTATATASAGWDWLSRFPQDGGVALISGDRPFAHEEGAYDDQYGVEAADESGLGIANLLRKFGSDFGGPALELGCGTGKATTGLCKSAAFPGFLITDSSRTFVDLTRDKLRRNGIGLDPVRFAVLSHLDLDKLPPSSFSAVVLRSTLHHFDDVPQWIKAAARTLRPGGTLVFEEPCSSGYLLMGLIAKVAATAWFNGLRRGERGQAAELAEVMQRYHRDDVDKSEWEDKHVFRPDEMMVWARDAGLAMHFLPNVTFEAYAHTADPKPDNMDFTKFVQDYMRYCMGYGAASAERIVKAVQPLCAYVAEACRGKREPYLVGTFLLQKPPAMRCPDGAGVSPPASAGL
ncbi:MAG TPA: class I SAM-dependent methyltransferase [Beijerinckiaceae bacterium]|jgi:ubiquinone/menaquinone biosynthesis C-methylase UbiE